MKQNLYFKGVLQPGGQNLLVTATILLLLLPTSFLETFIRRNMGVRRYERFIVIINFLILIFFGYKMFSITGGIMYFAIDLGILPWQLGPGQWQAIFAPAPLKEFGDFVITFWKFSILQMASWFIVSIWLLIAGRQRRLEIKRLPSVFDMARTSVYSGDIHPFFIRWSGKNKEPDLREIETKLEPGFFFLLGLALVLLLQPIGLVLIFCSLAYGLHYRLLYRLGDTFIMNVIDNKLFNEEKEEAFVELGINNAKGVRYYGRKPADPDLRRELADEFTDDEIAVAK
ncbi:hypothetical protein [Emticicia fluvialis]|uniref:hypothetical protein n=1 Tax=Emticicia fluvialis TaxID=2974474 RepID=UPI0021651A56|nr:hypothetical protein [Emticicia fluvialis]